MRLFPNIYRRRDAWLAERNGARILDVGCGRRKLPGAVGIDRRRRPAVTDELQLDIDHDLLDLPWPIAESSFDMVHCSHVLEHLQPTARVMEEIYRVLRPGGQVFIVCPHFSWVEAYRHFEHCHFFTLGSFDYFAGQSDIYNADFRVVRRELFFDDVSYALGIGFLANWFPRAYERHFAFIFPASQFYVVMEAVK
jgi:SAM-dependent methyltransferase